MPDGNEQQTTSTASGSGAAGSGTAAPAGTGKATAGGAPAAGGAAGASSDGKAGAGGDGKATDAGKSGQGGGVDLDKKPGSLMTEKAAEGKGGEGGEGKGADGKATDAAPLKPGDYKFTLPKGTDENHPLIGSFRDVAAEVGMTQEMANTFVGKYAERLTKDSDDLARAPYRAWNEMQTQWQAELRNDPEIGGVKLEQNRALIGRVIDKANVPGLREAMELTGAGNNPAITRFILKLAAPYDEATPVIPNPAGQGGVTVQKRLADMYPSTVQKT